MPKPVTCCVILLFVTDVINIYIFSEDEGKNKLKIDKLRFIAH